MAIELALAPKDHIFPPLSVNVSPVAGDKGLQQNVKIGIITCRNSLQEKAATTFCFVIVGVLAEKCGQGEKMKNCDIFICTSVPSWILSNNSD